MYCAPPNIAITVVPLSAAALKAQRALLGTGNRGAIAILAAHRDPEAVPGLRKLCRHENSQTRQVVYEALLTIGTVEALNAFGQALPHEPDIGNRLWMVEAAGKTGNPIFIPFLTKMLEDPYTARSQTDGKWYRVYVVRKWAVIALQKLGLKVAPPVLQEPE